MKKKILFLCLLVILPSWAFADDFVYRCFGNISVISAVFNAIAMITNSSGYGRLLEFVMFLGMIGATLYSIFTKKYDVIKYPAVALLVLGLFFWSKTSVTIYDETLDEYDVVDNIPIGFAYGSTAVSGVGYYFTKLYEQAFAIPTTSILFGKTNDVTQAMQYSKIGFGGAFQTLNEIKSFGLSAKTQQVFQEYFNNCVSYEVLASTNSDLETFFKLPTLINSDGTLNCNLYPNGFGTRWTLPTTIGDVNTTCKDACDNVVSVALFEYMDDFYTKYYNETKLFPKIDSLENVLTTFTNESYNMKQSLLQNAVIKSAFQSVVNENASSGIDVNKFTGIMSFLQGKEQGKSLAYYASEYIPAYRNVMEAIMIAVFPIIVIMFIFPKGWLFVKGYILSLFWIQLWHPISSVMNSIMVIMALKKSAMITNLVGSGYTFETATLFSDYADSMIGVTGFMMMSIPAIATIVVYGGNWVAGRMAEGIASSAMATAGASYSPEVMRNWLQQSVSAKMLNDSGVDAHTKVYNSARYSAFSDLESNPAKMNSIDTLSEETGYNLTTLANNLEKGDVQRRYINSMETQQVVRNFGITGAIGSKAYDELAQLSKTDYTSKFLNWGDLGKSQGMNEVKEGISTLESPEKVRTALEETSNIYNKYADILKKNGDYKNAERFELASKMMSVSSQLSDQDMLNRVETLKKAGAFAPIFSYEAGANATNGGGYVTQQTTIGGNKSIGEQRDSEEKMGKYMSMSSSQWIESGKMDAAERRALVEDFSPQRWEEIKHWQNTLLDGEIKGREEFWGSRSAYEKAIISESLIREGMMSGRIKGFDFDGDGKLNADEVKATAERYSQMTALMNRSDANEFWKAFGEDPQTALQALEIKYGEEHQALSKFSNMVREKGYTAEDMGEILANKKYFEMSYNDGYYTFMKDMGKKLGLSESILRASDPEIVGIREGAGILYDRLRNGKITLEEAQSSIYNLGFSRFSGKASLGASGDLAALAGYSAYKGFEQYGDNIAGNIVDGAKKVIKTMEPKGPDVTYTMQATEQKALKEHPFGIIYDSLRGDKNAKDAIRKSFNDSLNPSWLKNNK